MTEGRHTICDDKSKACEDEVDGSNWQYQGFSMLIWAVGLPIFLFAYLWPAAPVVQHTLLWMSLAVSIIGFFGSILAPTY
jgi:hypothetical protein